MWAWAPRGAKGDVLIGERDAVIFRRAHHPIVLLRSGDVAPRGTTGLVVAGMSVERGDLVLHSAPRTPAITLRVPEPQRARAAIERFLEGPGPERYR